MVGLKRILKVVVAFSLAIALCFTAGTTVFAQEAEENITNNTVTRSVPSGYTFVATYSRTPQTYSIGRIVVTSTSKMYLYIPKNGNLDLGQGTITFTPVSGGSATSFNFTNLSGENKVFDLSVLTPGTYTVSIYAYAYGTSGYVTIYYKYVP